MTSNDLDKAAKLRDELYPNHELATAIGIRLDVLAGLIRPIRVRREDGETDKDFRERAIAAYRASIAAATPERCNYCGCFYPCVCMTSSTNSTS